MADAAKLVAGLGNPGSDYEATRHNVGFRIVERLAERHGFPAFRRQRRGLFRSGPPWAETRGRLDGCEVVLLKPLSFMNRSGGPVAKKLDELGLEPEHMLVCYDDFALPLGRLRLRPAGSSGGHNGLQSVIEVLGTERVPRLRFGVQPAGHRGDEVKFVLSPFRPDERRAVQEALDRAADAVVAFCTLVIEAAINRFNGDPVRRG